jgi:hypothetical protein
MPKDTKYYTYQQASLSQKVGFNDKIFQKLAGSDKDLSDSIGVLLVLCEKGILDKDDPNIKLMLALLDVQRKAAFATSEKTNEITKLGLMLPKKDEDEDWSEDESG